MGAGVDQAITQNISLTGEYDYMNFGGSNADFPLSTFFPPLGFVPAGTTSVSDHANVFKLGVNYRLGGNGGTLGDRAEHMKTHATKGMEADLGARYWYSTGKFQWDNDDATGFIESRLTYSGLTAHSGEIYGRLDTPSNLFVKGNLGLGSISAGSMNDEDWGIFGFISYSNTVSNETGRLNYATADLGYDFWRGSNYKFGAFIGYNRFAEKMETRGCVQIANPLFPCLAPGDPTLIGTQDTTWDSFRVGTSGQIMIGEHVKLTGDVAYIPYTKFTGRDDHLLRPTETFFTQSGSGGQGVQAEAVLSMDVTDHLSLGVGGRYWGMWTDGTFTCTGCGGLGVTTDPPNPERISTERYGVLLEGAYHF